MDRSCGKCTACCFFTGGAGSDTYSPCRHCTNKCEIYDNRPEECINFKCLWLKHNVVPDELRPDRCGVMFEIPAGTNVCIGHVDPGNREAWKNGNVRIFIKKILEAGHSVVIYDEPMHVALTKGDTMERVKNSLTIARMKAKQ